MSEFFAEDMQGMGSEPGNAERQLAAAVAQIAEWQQARRLSDVALLKKFPGLGSTKTYKKILLGDFREVDVAGQLMSYGTVLALIEANAQDEQSAEEYYEDLFPTLRLREVFFQTSKETGLARLIIMQGQSGCGKSKALELLARKYGARIALMEATEAWNDSANAMLGDVLACLGKKDMPAGTTDRLNLAVATLRESRRCLAMDEAHHLGRKCLNVLKTLLNRTPGEFILAGVDTLWRKLESTAFEECRQLTGNRLAKRIALPAKPLESDVRKLLERRLRWADGHLERATQIACEKAAAHGRLAFVRAAAKAARLAADGDLMTLECFAQAVQLEVQSR